MALVKTWYTLSDATDKYGVPKKQIQEWIDEGVVRIETDTAGTVRVNVDDLRIEVEGYVRGDK